MGLLLVVEKFMKTIRFIRDPLNHIEMVRRWLSTAVPGLTVSGLARSRVGIGKQTNKHPRFGNTTLHIHTTTLHIHTTTTLPYRLRSSIISHYNILPPRARQQDIFRIMADTHMFSVRRPREVYPITVPKYHPLQL